MIFGFRLGVDFLAFIILNISVISQLVSKRHTQEKRNLSIFIVEAGFEIVLDVISGYIYFLKPDIPLYLFYIITILRFVIYALLCLSWLFFSEQLRSGTNIEFNRKNFGLYFVLAIFVLIFIVTDPLHKFIFTRNENGEIIFGIGFVFVLIVFLLFLIYPAVRAIISASKAQDYTVRKENLFLASFVVPYICGVIFQMLYPDFPCVTVGLTVGIYMEYWYLQNKLIATDSLTELNNFHQFTLHLNSKLHEYQTYAKNTILFLMMMDIDKFKSINDTYGHLEGDAALQYFAEQLRKSCGKTNCFIARYGGDEFAIVCEAQNWEEIDFIKERIRKNLEKNNKKPYQVSASIGVAMFSKENHPNAQSLIASADKELYTIKQARKMSGFFR